MTKAEKNKIFGVIDELNDQMNLDTDTARDYSEQLQGALRIVNALGLAAEYLETIQERTHIGYAYGKPVLWDGVQVVVLGTDISITAPTMEQALYVCRNNLAGFREV